MPIRKKKGIPFGIKPLGIPFLFMAAWLSMICRQSCILLLGIIPRLSVALNCAVVQTEIMYEQFFLNYGKRARTQVPEAQKRGRSQSA